MDTTRLVAQKLEHSLSVALHRPDGGTSAVPTVLGYDSSDPYALTITFRLVDGLVPWTFSRDLLSRGLTEPTGDGDVHVWPGLDDSGFATVSIELCSPHGDALVELRTSAADGFIRSAEALVAPGTESEHLDLDALITAIQTTETA
jgi:hypothetical protein